MYAMQPSNIKTNNKYYKISFQKSSSSDPLLLEPAPSMINPAFVKLFYSRYEKKINNSFFCKLKPLDDDYFVLGILKLL